MMKECVRRTGFKPRFVRFAKSSSKHKLTKALIQLYPYLKKYEISQLADMIDTSDDKSAIYESLGLTKPKKKKLTKKEKTSGIQEIKAEMKSEDDKPKEIDSCSWEDFLSHFSIEEK